MTKGQPLLHSLKPLTFGLTSMLCTSIMLLTISPYSLAATTTGNNTNVITSSPSSTSAPTNANATGVASPSAATTTTTTTPTTDSAITTAPVSTSTATTATTKPIVANPSAPADQANLSDNDILNWAATAAQLAYTYDFKNYPKQIQMLQEQFTPEGWKAFNAALKQSNNLTVVKNRKLVASATPTGKPVIVKEGVKNGLYTWRVQIPVQATYESESRLIKQNLMITMLIARSSSNPKGVGITHFVAVIVPSNPLPLSTPTTTTDNLTSTTTPAGTTSIYNQSSQTPTTSTPSTTTTTTPNTNSVTTTTTPSTIANPAGSNTVNSATSSPSVTTPSAGNSPTTSNTPGAPVGSNNPPSANRRGLGSMGTGNTIPSSTTNQPSY